MIYKICLIGDRDGRQSLIQSLIGINDIYDNRIKVYPYNILTNIGNMTIHIWDINTDPYNIDSTIYINTSAVICVYDDNTEAYMNIFERKKDLVSYIIESRPSYSKKYGECIIETILSDIIHTDISILGYSC